MQTLGQLLNDQNSGACLAALDRQDQMRLAELVYDKIERPDVRLRFVLHVMRDLPRLPCDSELTVKQRTWLLWATDRAETDRCTPNGPLELWQAFTEACGLENEQ